MHKPVPCNIKPIKQVIIVTKLKSLFVASKIIKLINKNKHFSYLPHFTVFLAKSGSQDGHFEEFEEKYEEFEDKLWRNTAIPSMIFF